MTVLLVLSLFALATAVGVGLDAAHESIRAKAFRMLPVPLLAARAIYSLFIGGVNAPACCTWAEAAIHRGNDSWEMYLNIFLIALLADTLLTALTDAFYRTEPPRE